MIDPYQAPPRTRSYQQPIYYSLGNQLVLTRSPADTPEDWAWGVGCACERRDWPGVLDVHVSMRTGSGVLGVHVSMGTGPGVLGVHVSIRTGPGVVGVNVGLARIRQEVC